MTLNWMPFGDEVRRLGFLAIHRQSDAMEIARLDGETDGGAVLAVDDDVGERRDAGDFDADRRQETAGDGDRLDRLVDRAGADLVVLGANGYVNFNILKIKIRDNVLLSLFLFQSLKYSFFSLFKLSFVSLYICFIKRDNAANKAIFNNIIMF